jgi:hypothetical protein
MNVGIGTEASLFPEKEYIMEISFAVCQKCERNCTFMNLTLGTTTLTALADEMSDGPSSPFGMAIVYSAGTIRFW